MPKEKQYVCSLRTTAEGLKALSGLKARLGVNWDALLIDAVNAHYGVSVPRPPRKEPKPKRERPPKKGRKPKQPKAEKKAEAVKVEPRTLPKAEG
jgi:hypothetical protein